MSIVINQLDSRIKIRRASSSTYQEHPTFLPLNGEICLEDTVSDGLKIKVGDGQKTFQNLPYEFIGVIQGYYYNDEFYYSQSYTALISKERFRLYIDIPSNGLYYYNGYEYIKVSATIGLADDTVPGIMKLYNGLGQNEDGTSTQKAITNGIDDVKFYVDGETLKAKY